MNKTQRIREALAANPNMTPKEIASQLGDVTPQYVSMIKSKDKREGTPKKRGRKSTKKTGTTNTETKTQSVAARTVRATVKRGNKEWSVELSSVTDRMGDAANFVKNFGGFDEAIEAINTLKSLQIKS